MILDQIDALNTIKYNLREIHSLMTLFSIFHRGDSSYTLEAEVYSDFGSAVAKLILDQKSEVASVSTKLQEIDKELYGLEKTELLKRGEFNG